MVKGMVKGMVKVICVEIGDDKKRTGANEFEVPEKGALDELLKLTGAEQLFPVRDCCGCTKDKGCLCHDGGQHIVVCDERPAPLQDPYQLNHDRDGVYRVQTRAC
eukprot:Hpha_TRINITY_DN12412_c0_g1::TRINITY_DN12412_c0_g1_i1::g.42975::m.42975